MFTTCLKKRCPGDMTEASGPPGRSTTMVAARSGEREPRVESPSDTLSVMSGQTPNSGHPAPGPGVWVERWLSIPRFARYQQAVGGDRATALDLYEWNVAVSAAFLHDLAHLEIGLRNAYDRVLDRTGPDWTQPSGPLFAPLWRTRPGKGRVDVNARNRQTLSDARCQAGSGAPRGAFSAFGGSSGNVSRSPSSARQSWRS